MLEFNLENPVNPVKVLRVPSWKNIVLKTMISKLKPQPQSHGSCLQRSRWGQKVAQTRGREIGILRAKVEDRRIERIEGFDLRRAI